MIVVVMDEKRLLQVSGRSSLKAVLQNFNKQNHNGVKAAFTYPVDNAAVCVASIDV